LDAPLVQAETGAGEKEIVIFPRLAPPLVQVVAQTERRHGAEIGITLFPAFAEHPDRTVGEVDVVDHQTGQLGKPDAGIQEQFDDGPFAWSGGDVAKQSFELLFGVDPGDPPWVAWRRHPRQRVGGNGPGSFRPAPEAADGPDVGIDRNEAQLPARPAAVTGRLVLEADDEPPQEVPKARTHRSVWMMVASP
jgi:hypothetical protein